MAVPCPTCGKDVDPLRAPAVRVIAGKITSYCSAACADQLPKAAAAITLPPAAKRAVTAAPRRAASSPAVAIEADAPVARPPRRRRLVIGLTAGIVIGGMAVAIIQAASPSTPKRVEAADPPRLPAIDAGVDAAP